MSLSTGKTPDSVEENNSAMYPNRRYRYCQLGVAIALGIGGVIASVDCAIAQIVPDATLGTENSVVTPQSPESNVDLIQGGATRGANLFHSFEQFSLPTGSAAFFNNATDIQNIISRVTGASISNIDGLIQANGTANLFLLNPNGIIFGPNATLNIGGSFLGSTATSLNFADGSSFSATAHPTTPLLTISVPIGLQFAGTAGSIINQSRATDSNGQLVGLQVLSGKSLALVGGDVRLDGGWLQAPGGRVELGGLAGAGTVGLSVDSNNLLLSFPDDVARADVYLTNNGSNIATVEVAASNGGNIGIAARNVDISGDSELLAGIATGLGFAGAQAGDIKINATGVITVAGRDSSLRNVVSSEAVGNAGNINITTGSLSVTNGAQLDAISAGQGNAGNIDIKTGSLLVSNGAQLDASVDGGRGNAGNITIDATDTVDFDGVDRDENERAQAISRVNQPEDDERVTVGNGGNIDITARSLSVKNGAQLATFTEGQGNVGNITIDAIDTVSFDGENIVRGEEDGPVPVFSRAETNVRQGAVGKGGNIDITARSLSVTNGAALSTATRGLGNAGNITIRGDAVSFDGVGTTQNSRAISRVENGGVGNGGNIDIMAGSLSVTNGAGLTASTRGQGNAGNVTIRAIDTVSFDGVVTLQPGDDRRSGAFSSVEDNAVGNGGNIDITASSLSLTNGAQVSAAVTGGQGNGGSIWVDASDSVNLVGVGLDGFSSGLFSSTEEGAIGQAGDITVATDASRIADGAIISVSSFGTGNAGSIKIEANSIRLDNQGQLTAETASGEGGNIELPVQDLLLMRRNSLISTEALSTGNSGNIDINTEFLVAVPSENSDILASANRGGNIDITAQGIFGVQFRESLTPESDITATGTVTFNTPDVDPNRGLVNLPAELVDVSNQIAAGCGAGSESIAKNEFIITGRGGLPPSPNEPLSGEAVLTQWVTLKPEVENRSTAAPATNSPRVSTPTQIVEANGWEINNKGEIILTANAPITPHSPAFCSGS